MRKFLIVWTGQAFSLCGSATVLATATLVGLLPQVLAGPFVGALVDRRDRKRIMIAADLAVAGVTAGLVALFPSVPSSHGTSTSPRSPAAWARRSTSRPCRAGSSPFSDPSVVP